MLRVLIFCLCCFPLHSMSSEFYITHGTQGLFSQVNMNIVDAIYAGADVKPSHVFEPQMRSMVSANKGKADAALFSVADNAGQYPQLMALNQPHYHVNIHTFSTQLFEVNDWADLSQYKIAYLAGFLVAHRKTEGMDRIETKTLEQALKLLDAGRVDVVIATADSGLEIINQWPNSQIVMQKKPIQTIPLFHHIHKRHQSLISQLNNSLDQLLTSGKINDIIQDTLYPEGSASSQCGASC